MQKGPVDAQRRFAEDIWTLCTVGDPELAMHMKGLFGARTPDDPDFHVR